MKSGPLLYFEVGIDSKKVLFYYIDMVLVQAAMAGYVKEESIPPPPPKLLIRIMSKRRTWVFLFISVYTILLSSSWNLLKSVVSWYESTVSSSSNSSGWPAIYASVALGVIFGLLSMGAALAVAVPATLVTWITVLVLLTFCGKPRKALLVEGKQLTAEITGFVVKILIKEGNFVAAVCAVLGYYALVRKNRDEGL